MLRADVCLARRADLQSSKFSAPARNYLVKRILEEQAFQAVTGMARWPVSVSSACFVDISSGTENLEGQVLKESGGSLGRQVRRVICKWTQFVRHADRSPARMHAGGNRVDWMMNINCEI
jgi:hypothetical protein